MNYYVAFYKMKQIRLICNIHNQAIINYNWLDEGINVAEMIVNVPGAGFYSDAILYQQFS